MAAKKPKKIYHTEDGYTFYQLSDGSVVDNLDPDLVDLAWDSEADFVDEAGPVVVQRVK